MQLLPAILRSTQRYLIERWKNDLYGLHTKICSYLVDAEDSSEKFLPKTENQKFDFRGFRTPKKMGGHRSNSGNLVSYPISSIRIKSRKFENFDFSLSDFEACEFYNCQFISCAFYKARWRNCRFYNCSFIEIDFQSTDLADSVFNRDLFSRNRNNDLYEIKFLRCNLTNGHILKQVLTNVTLSDCKTGFLSFDKCKIDGLVINGDYKNGSLTNNRYLKNLNLSNADVEGLQLRGKIEKGNTTLQNLKN